MTIGENIKQLRLDADLTQEELAEKLEVARSTVTQWERGWSKPRIGKVQQLAEVLHVRPSDIVSDRSEIRDSSQTATPSGSHSDDATIPLVTLERVRAGTFPKEELAERSIEIPRNVALRHPHARAVLVEDDCMNRVIPEGWAAVYDAELVPTNGQIAIVGIELHEAVMRRWYRGGNTLMLVADSHTHYEDIILPDGDAPIRLIGRVVWAQPITELG